MDQIVLEHVTKSFTTKSLGTVIAVKDFNLSVKKGECFSFLGPSGCGKTTTLRMIAGFEDLSEGSIYLGGRLVSDKKKNIYLPPERRNLGMVFQAFAVWPHLNVYDNVAFPLKVKKCPRSEIKKRVALTLHHANLDGLEKVYPSDLSGGQQQRIALARAMVVNPDVMLLDEPLSNLDPHLRESMRFEIKRLQKEFGFTIIFVTHDQAEAMALSDRMLVMDMGNIQQIGTPQELYHKPVNRFVYNFLGQSNFTDVVLRDGRAFLKGDEPNVLFTGASSALNGDYVMATRPNAVDLNRREGYAATILKRTSKTEFMEYLVSVGKSSIMVQTPHRNFFRVGERCFVKIKDPAWYRPEEKDNKEARERRNTI
jgi:iron(III) transport system ATP-binding protein